MAGFTVTYVDNQDGTGITATIIDPRAEVIDYTAFTQNLNGIPDNWEFLEKTTRTGEGTLLIPVSGSHFRYIKGGEEVSPVTFGFATNEQPSVHYQCMLAIQARLRTIGLDGIQNDDIVIRKLPTDRGTRFELNGTNTIVIAPPGVEGQIDSAGTNLRDDVEYPVVVTILRADNSQVIPNLDQGLMWRQQINRALRQQRLAGVDTVYKVKIQPGPVIDQSGFWNNRYVSSFIIRPVSREPRGI